MEAAHIYFALMVFGMTLLIGVHIICREIVRKWPQTMNGEKRRKWYRWSELMMALACLSMLWYMWSVLDFMVTFCATSPIAGALAHVPWIVFTYAVLGAKWRHLKHLIDNKKS